MLDRDRLAARIEALSRRELPTEGHGSSPSEAPPGPAQRKQAHGRADRSGDRAPPDHSCRRQKVPPSGDSEWPASRRVNPYLRHQAHISDPTVESQGAANEGYVLTSCAEHAERLVCSQTLDAHGAAVVSLAFHSRIELSEAGHTCVPRHYSWKSTLQLRFSISHGR